jgi:hypothetical protein
MKTITVATSSGPWASGVSTPRAAAPIAVQIIAGPSPRARMTRDANSEPTSEPTPPADTTRPKRNGSRCSSWSRKMA